MLRGFSFLKNFNPLLVYWRPKDIQPVLDGLDTIPCDKLYMNYFPYPYNYTISRDFFLASPQYTHYIAQPNDLVPTLEIYRKLTRRMEANPDKPVICGVCNWDTGKYKDYINITSNLPELAYQSRVYRKISKNRYPNTFLKVPWAGFPFMFIRRDVVEKIPFAQVPFETKDRPVWETKGGFGGDVAFAHSCKFYNIPIWADTSCNMEHLRFYGEMLVGKKPPNIEFKSYDGSLKSCHKENLLKN